MRSRVKELREVLASELVPNPANWRTHPPEQRAALEAVLTEIGFAGALLAHEVDGALVLIDGHERLAMADPADVLPVLVLDVDANEANQLLATFDPIGAMATRDDEALAALLESTDASAAVAGVLERLHELSPKPDDRDVEWSPELPAVPITKPGDTLVMGEHRMVCGETYDPWTMQTLLQGEPAQMLLTDPPFAIYGSSTGVASDVADDGMVQPFFSALGRLAMENLEWYAHAYVHCDWRSWSVVWIGLRDGGLTPKNCIVWDKGDGGLGAAYGNMHEFVGYFAKVPAQGVTMRGLAVQAQRNQQRQVYAANMIRHPRVRGDDRLHNAAKPVALLADLIGHSSDPGGIVLDPFAGSGSTLIAAEQQGRRAYLVDKKPGWCDVTADRWARFTGAQVVRQPREETSK